MAVRRLSVGTGALVYIQAHIKPAAWTILCVPHIHVRGCFVATRMYIHVHVH